MSGRSFLTRRLRESLAVVREAALRKIPPAEIRGRSGRAISRRKFIGSAAAATAGLAFGRGARAGDFSRRIVVVGAGLAGLRVAHLLWTRKGIASTIYEANTRLGGRCWSNTDFFARGQVAEHGGEFISVDHKFMRALAAEFALPLADVDGGSEPAFRDVCWLDENYYTVAELDADLTEVWPTFLADRSAASYPTFYNRYTPASHAFDHMSCTEWVERNVSGGAASKLGRILLCNQIGEYGCEPDVQPALNLLYLITGRGTTGLSGSVEKYHVIGGNDQIPAAMAAELPAGALQFGLSLIALRERSDGTYRCTFSDGAKSVEVAADHVVLALPFNQLKRVDLSRAGFSQVKMAAINRYSLGTNAKLALQFHRRPWASADHWSGSCYTAENDFQLSWDATVSQSGPSGILLRFPGGSAGGADAFPGAAAHGIAPEKYAQQFLDAVERPFPGCQANYNGLAWLDWWEQDPFIGGAYGCYRLGDYTSFAGIESVSEGNVHFCGEQTDLNYQGFMEGAIRSAEQLIFHRGIF